VDIILALLIADAAGAVVKLRIDLDEPAINRPAYTRSLVSRWALPLLWPLIGLFELLQPPLRSKRYRELHFAEYALIGSAGLSAGLVSLFVSADGVNHAFSALIGACVAALVFALGMRPFRRIRARRSHFHMGEKDRLVETWRRRRAERESAYAACESVSDPAATYESFKQAREFHEAFMQAARLEGTAFAQLRRLDPKLAKELHQSYSPEGVCPDEPVYPKGFRS